MIWMVLLPSGSYEHIVLNPAQRMNAFNRLSATSELSEVFCAPVKDGIRFAEEWIGRWCGLPLYVLREDEVVDSLDVTALFMAYFLSHRISCLAQKSDICQILADKPIYTQIDAEVAIQGTFEKALTLLYPSVTDGSNTFTESLNE